MKINKPIFKKTTYISDIDYYGEKERANTHPIREDIKEVFEKHALDYFNSCNNRKVMVTKCGFYLYMRINNIFIQNLKKNKRTDQHAKELYKIIMEYKEILKTMLIQRVINYPNGLIRYTELAFLTNEIKETQPPLLIDFKDRSPYAVK